jgi:hypothetical protein
VQTRANSVSAGLDHFQRIPAGVCTGTSAAASRNSVTATVTKLLQTWRVQKDISGYELIKVLVYFEVMVSE